MNTSSGGGPASEVLGGTALGVDVGATLVKLAIRAPSGEIRYELRESRDRAGLVTRLHELEPALIGITGGGAVRLAEAIELPSTRTRRLANGARG